MNERIRKVVSMDKQELWLLRARDLLRWCATDANPAIRSTTPVPLINGRDVWQQHGSLQGHGGVQHLHGDVDGRTRRRRCEWTYSQLEGHHDVGRSRAKDES
jgi:hypothetical protein